LNVYVLLGEAGEIRAENEIVIGLDEIHRRNPPAQRRGAAVAWSRPGLEESVEQPVHLVLDGAQLAYRLPTNQCHVLTPMVREGLMSQDIMKSKSRLVKSVGRASTNRPQAPPMA